MKILLIDVYNFTKGGAETVCFNTGELLREHGHEVVYFTLKWSDNRPSPYEKYFPESKETRHGPLRQVRNLINYFYHFEAAKKIEQLILDEKPNIAHIHLMWGQITPSVLPVLRRHGIPVLFTVHDYRIVCPAYTFRNGRGRICEECRGRHFYKCAINACAKGSRLTSAVMAAEQYFRNAFFNPATHIDGFIYVSKFAKDIQEKYMPAAAQKPNTVLYNFSTSITDSPKAMPKDKYFLFFGRLSYEKGVETLMDAFAGIPHCKLKIAGTGPLEQELKDKKDKLMLNNVEFLGYLTGRGLTDTINGAAFVVVPSEWYENNPMTIIEAYSAGTPVIGADIGGISEIVADGETGFLFKSADVEDLRGRISQADSLTSGQYSAMSKCAIQFARENLSKENYWEQLICFYSKFVNRAQGKHLSGG